MYYLCFITKIVLNSTFWISKCQKSAESSLNPVIGTIGTCVFIELV